MRFKRPDPATTAGLCGIYVIGVDGEKIAKVGISANPRKRFVDLQEANWSPLVLHQYWWITGRPRSPRKVAEDLESAVKAAAQPHNIRGEWFKVSCGWLADLVVSKATELHIPLWEPERVAQAVAEIDSGRLTNSVRRGSLRVE